MLLVNFGWVGVGGYWRVCRWKANLRKAGVVPNIR
jgi:hypothetical protein